MNIEDIRDYCLAQPDSIETTPFDQDTLVYKVSLKNGKSKMFALTSLSNPDYVTLKCDPLLAIELRERYAMDVQGAYHFNKKHWNGVSLNGSLTSIQIRHMIDHSYQLVVRNTDAAKSLQDALEKL